MCAELRCFGVSERGAFVWWCSRSDSVILSYSRVLAEEGLELSYKFQEMRFAAFRIGVHDETICALPRTERFFGQSFAA